jgi:hypothetical protein
VLFTPPTTPDASTHIAWADVLPLLDSTTCLFGPFSFSDPTTNPPGRTPSFRQFIHADHWASLTSLCLSRGIAPPILTSFASPRSRWTRSSRSHGPPS